MRRRGVYMVLEKNKRGTQNEVIKNPGSVPEKIRELNIGESFSYKCTGNKYGNWENGDFLYDKHLRVWRHKLQKNGAKVCGNRNKVSSIRNNLKRRNGWSHFSVVSDCVQNENGEYYTTVTRTEDVPQEQQNVREADKGGMSRLRSATAHKNRNYKMLVNSVDILNRKLNPENTLEKKNFIGAVLREYNLLQNKNSYIINKSSVQNGRKPRKELSQYVLNRDNQTCHYCGKHENELNGMRRMVVDHIIPWSILKFNNVLDHEDFNLVAACEECNYSKSDMLWNTHCDFCFSSYEYYKELLGEDKMQTVEKLLQVKN